MKLAELAMAGPAEDEGDGEDVDSGAMFEDAVTEAFDLMKQGKKSEGAAALKSAIESCVADYMAEE